MSRDDLVVLTGPDVQRSLQGRQREVMSAVGAAYLGFKSLGLIKNYLALKPKQDASYTPNLENHALYQKAFAIFEILYKKMKPEMEMLLALRE